MSDACFSVRTDVAQAPPLPALPYLLSFSPLRSPLKRRMLHSPSLAAAAPLGEHTRPLSARQRHVRLGCSSERSTPRDAWRATPPSLPPSSPPRNDLCVPLCHRSVGGTTTSGKESTPPSLPALSLALSSLCIQRR